MEPPEPHVESLAKAEEKRVLVNNRWVQLCSFENCENYARINNLCVRHNADETKRQQSIESDGSIAMNRKLNGNKWLKFCSVSKCKRYAQKDDLCSRHFAENKNRLKSTKNIDMDGQNGGRFSIRTCSVGHCYKYVRRRGLCWQHFKQHERYQNFANGTTISHQSSTHSMIEESDITSNNSTNSKALTTNHPQPNTFDGYQNIQTTTLQEPSTRDSFEDRSRSEHLPFSNKADYITPVHQMESRVSSILIQSSDISFDAVNDTANKQNNETSVNRCAYQSSTIDDRHCQNTASSRCSHCSSSFCLEHGLQHKNDLEEEINCLLDEAQELIAEIPSLNIESGRKNCIEQFKHWMEIMLDKIKQKFQQFKIELDQFHSYIEMNKDKWKKSLKNRTETRVTFVLTEQLKKHEIDGLELNKARDELVRLQKLCDLLNSQTLITVASVEESAVDLNIPRLIFPSVTVDGLNWIDECLEQKNSETMECSIQQKTTVNENTTSNEIVYDGLKLGFDSEVTVTTMTTTDPIKTDQVKKVKRREQSVKKTTENSLLEDVLTAEEVPYVTDRSMDNTVQEMDLSPIQSPNNNMENLVNLSANIGIERTNSTSPALPSPDYHNSKLEQIIKDQKDDEELNLKSEHLTCQDMKIVAHHLLTDIMTPITLNLSWNQIGDEGAHYLTSALQWNKTFTRVNLLENKITHEGAHYLSDVLQWNKTLTSLNLSSNQIGDEGAHHLSIALMSNMTLTTLDLSGNQIGNKGAQSLGEALKSNKTLTTLKLSRNVIQDKGALYLYDALKLNKTLTKLYLGWNPITKNKLHEWTLALNFNTNKRAACPIVPS